MRAVSAAQMKEIDRRAQQEFGIPELVLMEHAGTAAADEARRFHARAKRSGGEVIVLAGGGANGGDGFVVARHLDNHGIPVSVVLLADPGKVGGAARVNLEVLKRLRVPVRKAVSHVSWKSWSRGHRRVSVVVDAMLGTGMVGRVREPIASAIHWVNRQRCPVVSVDIPSGLSADTGQPWGTAVRATATGTCGLPKIGLRRGQGKHFCGRVAVADISLPRVLV